MNLLFKSTNKTKKKQKKREVNSNYIMVLNNIPYIMRKQHKFNLTIIFIYYTSLLCYIKNGVNKNFYQELT